jgi:predicted alpha/beta superfamily hydrolase
VLVGHSYGGLFAIWSLLTRPELFAGVVAVSPSLWYDARSVLALASESAAGRLYAATGDLENPAMARDLLALKERLAKSSLKSRIEVLEGETHNSIFPRALSNGLRFLWPRGTFEPSKAPGTRAPGQ